MSVQEKCPLSVPIPVTLSVNTSGTVAQPVASHSLAATHSGFTRISEFTFTSNLTGDNNSIVDLIDPAVTSQTAVWDFGDGYTLSAANTPTVNHTYNVPGIYTVAVYYYDIDGNAYFNTLTQSVSVYNYIETNIRLSDTGIDSVSGASFPAGSTDADGQTFNTSISTSWQDTTDDNNYTIFVTSSGSKSKPYDTKNKYAHLIPYNAFYDVSDGKRDLIHSTGLNIKLNKRFYAIDPGDFKIKLVPESLIQELSSYNIKTYMLGSTTDRNKGINRLTITGSTTALTGISYLPEKNVRISYYDDTPNTDPGVQLLVKIDTSKHRVKNFYVDEIETDINGSEQSIFETGGAAYKNYSGVFVKITKPAPNFANLFSFTSTGMKEMSALNYKRQGDKFQVFISLQDKNKNILKHYPKFLRDTTGNVGELSADNTFNVSWVSGGDAHTSNISSISTNKFPYNATTGNTELSSFLYLNIDPLSAGTWSLNVSATINSLSAGTDSLSGYGGNLGNVGSDNQHFTGSYTFTVYPSTNDTEFYLQNEHIDYSQVIKSYRFQSFMHEYDNLFDGIFTSFVGEASSSPTTFGKTIFSKIANFVDSHSDVDLCKIDQLQSFYDLLNEDIDILLPQPPSELKRLYDTFSIKVSKLLGGYEQFAESFDSKFYTSSADSRNIDFNNPITASTYTVTAYTNFVARQKFNNEFILVNPQKVATKNVDGSSSGESSTYALSTYNVYSNWGWQLDTTVSGASGLAGLYDFYPYTAFDTTSATENLKNNFIDYNNTYTTITRTASSLSGNWTNDDGIMYKNLDYQIRKGLNI